MSLVSTFRVGQLTCHALEGGLQHLDGGAMFGVVPKTLWSRRIGPDDRNRVPIALRCLLVEHDDGLVLVDTGLVSMRRDGTKRLYKARPEGLEEVRAFLDRFWGRSLDLLKQAAEQEQHQGESNE